MREPRRVALSLLYEIFGDGIGDMDLPPLQSLGSDSTRVLRAMIQREMNCPSTSSIGRLFDGISALIGLSQINSFEGQAAMKLEFLADSSVTDLPSFSYHLPLLSSPCSPESLIVDWQPMIHHIVHHLLEGKDRATIAWSFHRALARLVTDMAERMSCPRVVLSGGVFQNGLLLSLTERLLTSTGFQVFFSHGFGPNDGGLSVGQCLIAGRQFRKRLKGNIRLRQVYSKKTTA